MLNQKDVLKLVTVMFFAGASAMAYATATTTPDTAMPSVVTPEIATQSVPAVPDVDGSLEVETPDLTEVPEVPEVAELPEAMEAPEAPETHASR